MKLKEIKNQLMEVHLNYSSRNSKLILEVLGQLKQRAVEQKDQDSAKEIWCLEQILEVQDTYLDAYKALKSGEYYNGWRSLERTDIEYTFLFRHFKEHDNKYWIEFINKHTTQYQSLFPYKAFVSPEYLKKEVKCSICDQVINIRNHCGHRVGEIYNGEMCTRLITKVKLLGGSIVTSPLQKYSVCFPTDPKTGQRVDHYNYSYVKFVIDRLQSPFDNWDIHWTKKRHPHSRYSHIGRNDKCPCESGRKYKDCCLPKSGVLRPHCQIEFSVKPPEGLSMFEYTD